MLLEAASGVEKIETVSARALTVLVYLEWRWNAGRLPSSASARRRACPRPRAPLRLTDDGPGVRLGVPLPVRSSLKCSLELNCLANLLWYRASIICLAVHLE